MHDCIKQSNNSPLHTPNPVHWIDISQVLGISNIKKMHDSKKQSNNSPLHTPNPVHSIDIPQVLQQNSIQAEWPSIKLAPNNPIHGSNGKVNSRRAAMSEAAIDPPSRIVFPIHGASGTEPVVDPTAKGLVGPECLTYDHWVPILFKLNKRGRRGLFNLQIKWWLKQCWCVKRSSLVLIKLTLIVLNQQMWDSNSTINEPFFKNIDK